MRQSLSIARADLMQRVRAPSFSVSLLLALLLAYAIAAGKLRLLAGPYEGMLDAAWIGSMLSMTVTTLVALFGFYIINNAISLDLSTGVYRVLAASPVSRTTYCFGKWLSSTAILLIIVATLFASALVVQFIRTDVGPRDVTASLALMIGITLPMMALVASCALLFETLSFRHRGIGNMLWMPCFLAALSGMIVLVGSWNPALDPSGLELIKAHLVQCVQAVAPGYDGTIALTFAGRGSYEAIACNTMNWSPPLMLQRLALLSVSAGIVSIAAWRLNRLSDSEHTPAESARNPKTRTIRRIVGADAASGSLAFEELRLMVLEGGMTWIVGGTLFVLLAMSVPIAAIDWVLLGAWLIPALPLSRLGCREQEHGINDLLTPVSTTRLVASRWAAGFIALILCGAGAFIRQGIEGNFDALWTMIASACFIAAIAVACGAVAKSEKMFQVIYVVLIYLGPINGISHWNFVSTQHPSNAEHWLAYALVALGIAAAGRGTQDWLRTS